jgi:threonine synthase
LKDFRVYGVTLLPYSPRSDTVVVAEFALPTGSFKDRGAAAAVAAARAAGARRVTLDSSGNAGLAVAIEASRSGLATILRVASSISEAKLALLRSTGADVEIHPTRAEAARACVGDRESYDASHVRNAVFRRGVSTLARAWVDRGEIPPTIYLPCGNGSLLLGLWQGLQELRDEGRLATPPRLVACQPDRCAPIARAGDPGDGRTIADGCAVKSPPAAAEIRAAIEQSGGRALAIPEEEIRRAWIAAWHRGFPIEPTSALAFAARELEENRGPAAVIATGSGLKLYPGNST